MTGDETQTLADLLGHPHDDEPDYTTEPLPAQSLIDADDRLRRIAYWDRQAADVIAMATTNRLRIHSELETVDRWQTEQLERIAKRREWWAAGIEAFAVAAFQRQKTRSISLPHGTIRAKKGQTAWEVYDADAFLKWAADHAPDLINPGERPPVPTPDKNAMKATLRVDDLVEGETTIPYFVSPDGERIDAEGVDVTRVPDVITIEAAT